MPVIIENNEDLKIVGLGGGKTRKTKPLIKKMFHNENLTGTGGKAGLINDKVHPANVDRRYQPTDRVIIPTTVKTTTETSLAETTVTTTPTEILLRDSHAGAIDYLEQIAIAEQKKVNAGALPGYRKAPFYRTKIADRDDMLHINPLLSGGISDDLEHQLFLELTPQTVFTRDISTPLASGKGNNHDKSLHVLYRATLYVIDDVHCQTEDTGLFDEEDQPVLRTLIEPAIDDDGVSALPDVATVRDPGSANPLSHDGVDSFACVDFGFEPADTLNLMLASVYGYLFPHQNNPDATFDDAEFTRWAAEEYSLYDNLRRLGESINGHGTVDPIIDYMTQVTEAFVWAHAHMGDKDHLASAKMHLTPMTTQLRLLEYRRDMLLSAYSELFDRINAIDDGGLGINDSMIKQNLNLKLNGNLQELDRIRSAIPTPVPPKPFITHPRFSLQQVAAITALEPFIMVQAGAGTGKSTVITERIEFLIHCMTRPDEILVASFTNAAADNITERSPGVRSQTIAKVIHDIYMHNYPKHELSSIDTIVNSLEIFYKAAMVDNPFLQTFRNLLNEVMKKASNATMTRLSTFVENFTSEVVNVLDTLGQTCLELEIIISYIRIEDEDFTEPATAPRHIIIDEVQDNSTYEFVYMLRYAVRHKATLYLVGDSSQTLYEFRAANPKALNALEGSGVFQPYRLTTNYRSKQVILDVANVMLRGIDANQFAKIQLRANELTEATAADLEETITVRVERAANQQDFSENLGVYLKSDTVLDFIRGNLQAGRQTCLLAYTRRDVKKAMESLQESFPDIAVEDLTSARAYNATTFSNFVRLHWDEVTAVDPASSVLTIKASMMNHLHSLEPRTAGRSASAQEATKAVVARINRWEQENATVLQLLIDRLFLNLISKDQFYADLRQNLLEYEIQNNAVRQSLLSRDNDERKRRIAATKPPLMVSTIHGVKGLEFDSTIVVRPPDTDDARAGNESEESKRMYYVALTRAKHSELILAGSSKSYPIFASMYEIVHKRLSNRDDMRARRAASDALIEAQTVYEELDAATIAESETWFAELAEDYDAGVIEEMYATPSPILMSFEMPELSDTFDSDNDDLGGQDDGDIVDLIGEPVTNPRHLAWSEGTLDDYDAATSEDGEGKSGDSVSTEEIMAAFEAQRAEIKAKREAALGVVPGAVPGVTGAPGMPAGYIPAAPGTPLTPSAALVSGAAAPANPAVPTAPTAPTTPVPATAATAAMPVVPAATAPVSPVAPTAAATPGVTGNIADDAGDAAHLGALFNAVSKLPTPDQEV